MSQTNAALCELACPFSLNVASSVREVLSSSASLFSVSLIITPQNFSSTRIVLKQSAHHLRVIGRRLFFMKQPLSCAVFNISACRISPHCFQLFPRFSFSNHYHCSEAYTDSSDAELLFSPKPRKKFFNHFQQGAGIKNNSDNCILTSAYDLYL
ncbi:hypothetical protein Tcan_00133 [Toxocara canis]|uniref:Uncharacterized protein n=1 Tax=Toxocara canis TaxID=6265 RepID=A0A0B2VRR0_TOXCA|nr:hypothetical protein Tcan_00133 [Toxocara canis]